MQIKELQTQLHTLRHAIVCSFNQLLDLKDFDTGVHCTRLAEWAVRVGRDLGLGEEELQALEQAAILHDIGKVAISESILNKPGKLTGEERAVMQRHSEFGWAILRVVPGFERVSLVVLHHHEAYDGSGYPAKLKGSEIPISARIVALIDAFDAMISERPYRAGLPIAEAIRRLEAGAGTQFDPALVPRFTALAVTETESVLEATGAGGM